jgi:mannose-6-phosphate isomerase-like protein (cupin superfamily)
MRRVVTGHDRNGRSVFARDEEPPHGAAMEGVPRFRMDLVWGSEGVPRVPADGSDPTAARPSFFPAPGGTRFCVVTFPPASDLEQAAGRGVDLAAAEKSFYERFPGLTDHMETDSPGMHTTQTVDYGVVLRGEISLELDDGAKVRLRPGDCVVQNGTRHTWRNESDRECVMAFVIVGAEKRPPG